jgi:hypothetical protein
MHSLEMGFWDTLAVVLVFGEHLFEAEPYSNDGLPPGEALLKSDPPLASKKVSDGQEEIERLKMQLTT